MPLNNGYLPMHEVFMRHCIELAQQARAQGNTPVGALVTLNEQVIAKAREQVPAGLDVTGHAEILAVRRACDTQQSSDLSSCTLYSTAEPCWMCSYAIRETGIRRVVFGARTPDVGGVSTRYPLLSDHLIAVWSNPPEIITGVLEADCEALRGS